MNTHIVEKLLLDNNTISVDELAMAREHMEYTEKTLIEIINDLGFCDETEVLRIINKSLGLNIEIQGSLDELYKKFDKEKISNFPYNLTHKISTDRSQVVIDYNDEEILILTSSLEEEKDRSVTALHFRKMTKKRVRYIATTHYNLILISKNLYENVEHKEYLKTIMNQQNYGDKLEKALSNLIEHAAIENSSDIYIALNKDLELSYIYFRIKRKKYFQYVFETKKMHKLLGFLFQKANMEFGKLFGHQDGSVVVPILNKKYNISLRINSISTIDGQHITIRLQDEVKELETLGFRDKDIVNIKKTVNKLKGIVLLVGATGSGKTTTMYSMLNEFNPYKYNIITMEDPVEIRKFGINQIPINPAGGQSFKDSIRACMRQAPDVILIGEIRDDETAERAIEAANTGHLVLATIHANSVSTVGERLSELGVKNTKNFIETISCGIYQELINDDGDYYLGYEIMFDGAMDKIDRYRLNGKEEDSSSKEVLES